MKYIDEDDYGIMPELQPFTISDLKIIHNGIMENGVPEGCLAGLLILGKIEIMLNEFI